MADTPEEGVQPDEGGEDTFYLGTYRTREEAEAGEKARSDKISQDGQRIKELEARVAAAENQAELLKALTEKVNARSDETKADPNAEYEAVADKIAEAMEQGDYKAAARLQLQVNAGWVGQSEEQLKATLKAEADALGITVKTLEKRLADREPDNIAYGDKAKDLAEIAGVELTAENRAMFLRIAKAQAGTDHPPRHEMPGGGPGTRVVGGGDSVIVGEGEKMAGFDKLPKATQERLKAKWKTEESR